MLYDKRPLCHTELSLFTDFQGVGGDPLYMRYNSVQGIVNHYIDERYRGFLAQPLPEDNDTLCWYVPAWGDTPPRALTSMTGAEAARYGKIYDDTLAHYRGVCSTLPTDDMMILAAALRYVDKQMVYCYDNRVVLVAWGMRPDTLKQPGDGRWVKEIEYNRGHAVTFDAGAHGTLADPALRVLTRREGSVLTRHDLPAVTAREGYRHTGWEPNAIGMEVRGPLTFTAQYSAISPATPVVPVPEPPVQVATPPPPAPQRWAGPPRWLLWLLAALLGLLLFVWLFNGCGYVGCTSTAPQADDYIAPVDSVHGRDDNGRVRDIVGEDGRLPEVGVVAPIVDEEGALPPIVVGEGGRGVVANRLNIYMEDENADLEGWVRRFKEVYPGEAYSVIGYDANVRMLQIMIPEVERDRLREELPRRLPEQRFFVVDETVISLSTIPAAGNDVSSRGWHLSAVGAYQAWKVTKGAPDVTVAIVDDGIDATHAMFENRFYRAYNVFTQDRRLSVGGGHGTMVAGAAAGGSEQLDNRVPGIAPGVRIMPVQVFDNGVCTFSSLVSGVMYAIHNGADVVNMSVGPSLEGMDGLPLSQQRALAGQMFKEEERVWRHVIDAAVRRNVILVMAAGNDNILTALLPECRTGHTINVGAVNRQRQATSFTNYAEGTNISAPGEGIWSSAAGGGEASADGTSMSAPIVAGAIALLRSVRRDLTASEALSLLQGTGEATDGDNRYVGKMVRVDRALAALQGGKEEEEEEEEEPAAEGDDLSALLRQLKAQREALDRRIEEIENLMKGRQ